MPAPTLRASNVQSPSGSGALGIAYPAGLVASDVVVLFANTDHSSPTTFSCPGFTQPINIFADAGLGVVQMAALVGTGFSGSGTFTVTPSDSAAWIGLAATAWIGADPTVIAGASVTSDGSPMTIPSLTTTVDDAVVLALLGNGFGSVASTTPSTTLVTNVGDESRAWVHTRGTQATAGASGTLDFTPGVNSRSSGGAQLAIQPSAAAGATDIRLGSSTPTAVHLGGSEVDAVYLGSNLIWGT